MSTTTLVEEHKLVGALKPAADAAGRAGRFISLKGAHKATIIVHIDQGDAAVVPLTIQQAQNVGGDGAKALAKPARIWLNNNHAAGDALVRQPDAVSFTTDATLAEKVVVIEIDPALLDQENGFDCLRISTGASNAANITQAVYVLHVRYGGSSQPSALSD